MMIFASGYELLHTVCNQHFKRVVLYFFIVFNSIMLFAMLHGIVVLSLTKGLYFCLIFKNRFCFKSKFVEL